MKVVYIDLLFITNLIPDYLLLRLTSILLGRFVRPWRMALGAVFAAVCALPLYLLPLSVYSALLAKAAVCALVCLITFGRQKLTGVCTLFCGMSFAFAGAVSAVCWLGISDRISVHGTSLYANLSLPMLCCAAVLAYCLMRLVFAGGRAQRGGKKVTVQASLLGREVRFCAYPDSGNLLREPFSGKAVIVTSLSQCLPLLPPDAAEIIAAESMPHLCFERLCRMYPRIFSLIPYSTAGGSGLMLCIRPQKVITDGKKDDRVIGISPEEITADGCTAIIGV